MPQLDLRAHIAAPVDLVYQVVADVEQYPSFLPDVAAVDRRDDIVAMTLRMGLMSTKLVTRARFTPSRAIDLSLVEGPFRRFDARWTFAPAGAGTDVAYHADYELPLIGSLFAVPARYLLEQQTARQMRAFEARVLARAAPPPGRAVV
jgi:ribosome-associated toxin RatA of RatAB toxin-antitoxin module